MFDNSLAQKFKGQWGFELAITTLAQYHPPKHENQDLPSNSRTRHIQHGHDLVNAMFDQGTPTAVKGGANFIFALFPDRRSVEREVSLYHPSILFHYVLHFIDIPRPSFIMFSKLFFES